MFWRGVWGYLPANVVQGVVGFATILLFTRVLTPEDFGRYALAFSVMAIAHTAIFTWIEAAMARFWAAQGDDQSLADHFATLYRSLAGLAAVFAPVAVLTVWLWPTDGAMKLALAAGLAAVLARTLLKLVQERLRASGEVAKASMLDIVQTVGGFAIGAAFAWSGFGGASPLIGLGLGALLCLPFGLPGEIRRMAGGRFEAQRAWSYAAYGAPVAASLILALVLTSTDRFLLAAFLDEAAVGAYHAGYSLANRTLDVIFIWLGAAGGPALVMALERGGPTALRDAAKEQASTFALIAMPAAVGLALVARPLAQVMIGDGLRDTAAAITPWIALSAVLAGMTTYYFHQAFTLGRRTPRLLLAMAAPAAANVLLNVILIPPLGVMGAAIATAASYGLGLVASVVLGRGAVDLPIPWDALARCGLASALMALAVALTPAWGGAPELILKALVGAGVYGVAAIALDAAGVRSRGSRVFKGFAARRTA